MFRVIAVTIFALASAPAVAQTPASLPNDFNPKALELFERGWLLMDWALRRFDSDGDVRLSLDEAQPAVKAFKEMADGDADGRVSTYEFERAKEFILARY